MLMACWRKPKNKPRKEKKKKNHTLYIRVNNDACSRLFKAVQKTENLKFNGEKKKNQVASVLFKFHKWAEQQSGAVQESRVYGKMYEYAIEIWNETCT